MANDTEKALKEKALKEKKQKNLDKHRTSGSRICPSCGLPVADGDNFQVLIPKTGKLISIVFEHIVCPI